jgi:uncharacterized protein (DUF1778 family)
MIVDEKAFRKFLRELSKPQKANANLKRLMRIRPPWARRKPAKAK